MKIKTTVTHTVEKDIELPYFFKYGSTYHRVDGEEMYIQVDLYKFSVGIMRHHSSVSLINEPISIQITEDEFNAAFDEALEKIQSLKTVAA